jgi:hypothetical protein
VAAHIRSVEARRWQRYLIACPRRIMSRYLAMRRARVSGRLASLIRQMIE